MEPLSTIAISRLTRDDLKAAGHKGQTYDELIRELLEQKREGNERSKDPDSHDREVESIQSSESRNSLELIKPASQEIKSIEVNKNLCDGSGCNREATTQVKVNVRGLGTIDLNLCENCKPKFKQSIITETSKSVCKPG